MLASINIKLDFHTATGWTGEAQFTKGKKAWLIEVREGKQRKVFPSMESCLSSLARKAQQKGLVKTDLFAHWSV